VRRQFPGEFVSFFYRSWRARNREERRDVRLNWVGDMTVPEQPRGNRERLHATSIGSAYRADGANAMRKIRVGITFSQGADLALRASEIAIHRKKHWFRTHRTIVL
jgi:hypothetical protein